MKTNKSGRRMYSDDYINTVTSNKSLNLVHVLTLLSLDGLRDVTAIAQTNVSNVYTYIRETKLYFVRIVSGVIYERNLFDKWDGK